MEQQRHIIKTQLVEMQTNSQRNAKKLHKKASRLFNTNMVPAMDKIFNSYSRPGEIHRIEKLELDLGRLKSRFSDSNFALRLQQSLKKELRRKMIKTSVRSKMHKNKPAKLEKREKVFAEASAKRDKAPQDDRMTASHEDTIYKKLELFIFFVRTGRLPWWADTKQSDIISEALKSLFAKAPDLLKKALYEVIGNQDSVKRIVLQFSENTLGKIAEILSPITGAALFNIYEALKNIMTKDARYSIRQGIFLSLSAYIKGSTGKKETASHLVSYILKEQRSSDSQFSAKISAKLKESDIADIELKKEIISILEKPGKEDQDVLDDKQEKPLQSPDTLPKIPRSLITKFSDSESVYIENAGLILSAQFLPEFFSKVGLVKNDKFISSKVPRQGACLLQYLADGSDEFFEHMLPLNKILCGMDISAPVSRFFDITKEAKAACKWLLEKMKESHPKLKNFSANEFKSVFLERKGSVSIRDRTWFLRVEFEGRDVLLEKDPEFLSGIRLPWMRNALFLDWI